MRIISARYEHHPNRSPQFEGWSPNARVTPVDGFTEPQKVIIGARLLKCLGSSVMKGRSPLSIINHGIRIFPTPTIDFFQTPVCWLSQQACFQKKPSVVRNPGDFTVRSKTRIRVSHREALTLVFAEQGLCSSTRHRHITTCRASLARVK